MTSSRNDVAEEHNRRQREYFATHRKPRMVPADTPYIRRHIEEMIRFANLRRGENILEVGCGMGRYTLGLAAQGLHLHGLDLTAELLDRLREFNGGRHEIPLYCADIMSPPRHLHGQFDAVIGFFTLHHLHDLAGSFTGMKHLLRPGGRIVFLEPNALNPLYYIQIAITPGMTWAGDRGIVNMRRNPILAALRQAGLAQPVLERFGFFPPGITNTSWGGRIETLLEQVPLWKSLLPFQLIRAGKPVGPP